MSRSEYENERNIQVVDYRPVFVQEDEYDSDEDIPTPSTNEYDHPHAIKRNKFCQFFAKFIYLCGLSVLSFDIVYILFLITMLHQSTFETVRASWSGYSSQPILEPYVTDCKFTWNNIKSGIDIWLFIHFGTYTLITFAVRNRTFMWINSIIWEIIEYSYYAIPIFNMTAWKECWYDIVIFDVLIFNALGIEFGLFTLKYIIKIYPLYTKWTISFKMLCKECKWNLKWIIIIINLLFLSSFQSLFSFAFYDYTFQFTINIL